MRFLVRGRNPVNRSLRHLLIALALLLGQQGTQLHPLSHFVQDSSRYAGGAQDAPPPGHPAAQCLMFHAVDSCLPAMVAELSPVRAAPPARAHVSLPLPIPPRIAFDPRAPPALS